MAPLWIRADQPLRESELSAQFHGPGFLGKKRLWAAFDDKATDAVGEDFASQPVIRLDERAGDGWNTARGAFRQCKGGSKPGDAPSDDDDMMRSSRHFRNDPTGPSP